MMRFSLLILLVAVAVHVDASCTYNGHVYADGEGFRSSDGCNSCGCNNGMVMCTLRACLQLPPVLSVASCHYNGQLYHDGATFTSQDGCNTCSCRHGSVLCTEMACILPVP